MVMKHYLWFSAWYEMILNNKNCTSFKFGINIGLSHKVKKKKMQTGLLKKNDELQRKLPSISIAPGIYPISVKYLHLCLEREGRCH